MTFKEVPYIPKTEYRKPRNDIASYLDEFMRMNIKYASVGFTDLEFNCCCTAACTIKDSCRRMRLPVNVYIRNSYVYLERTDM